MITLEVALKIYGVVIGETDEVDDKATARKRGSLRRERLRKGKTFDEFVMAWRKKKPKDHIIAQYGEWPEPRVPGYDRPFWGLYR